ncbi:DUF3182 family protein [Pseudomonas sp. GD03860]|uniref:DUF3182 family protein n=1 Tax=Pseudomonas TaxID=286 RepID=UPI0023635D80|nr:MULTISPECIES: DUF3182 family protein [Pseudomonas]MDD2061188.1 DUF3182 family protein [Pseudomonas putida]MDH0639165.1 DUF3182 family protein [Pseudomonas sp. GD03860]
MPRSTDLKQGVVLLDTREHTPEHEHSVHLKLAERLAQLLQTQVVTPSRPPTLRDNFYYLPTETLVDPAHCRALGISSTADLFGGVVSHPYMATKAISHPLPANARFPLGWTDDFARQASDALLRGYTVFSVEDATQAAALLLREGPLRIKPVRATAGRGQTVVTSMHEVEQALQGLDRQELALWGLTLEENLTQVQTFSVGQALVAGILCSYYGTQQLTRDHDGEEIYGGSDLVLVRGDYDTLLQLELEDHLRLAITQARTYELAAFHTLPGFMASRRNYDVALGLNDQGKARSGVLEQSWRIGGASSAEVLALQAFAADPALTRIRASTHEAFDTPELPADATIFYQGDDSEIGRICKYARIRDYDHP